MVLANVLAELRKTMRFSIVITAATAKLRPHTFRKERRCIIAWKNALDSA
jgi:hypothetical protein